MVIIYGGIQQVSLGHHLRGIQQVSMVVMVILCGCFQQVSAVVMVIIFGGIQKFGCVKKGQYGGHVHRHLW
jgi:hypothetical protein